ncbi:hypothetical protein RUM43_005578 [Polyplax serrata]|uniref:RING-CH-type domain-containing protein n=1 Tax=Polyplax serrata TaxID=468196 RepID=A0AAN8S8P4_POLSC
MEGFPARETSSQDENAMNLTGRLLEFAPGVASEQLTEKQEIALKKATFYFYKQLMLQQNKTNHLVSLPFPTLVHSFASLINPLTLCFRLNKSHVSLESSPSDTCRICREAGSKEDLLTTCRCKGTMKFIHLSCLERWLAESGSNQCELCSFQYKTVRTPKYSVIKSIILWLQNPGRRRDARELMLDFLALIVLTPMAFFGTYMALLAADTWYNTEDSVLVSPTLTRIVSLGCLGVIGAIDTAYLSWLLLRAQHHVKAWHRWRRKNCFVTVILSPPKVEEDTKISSGAYKENACVKTEEVVSMPSNPS